MKLKHYVLYIADIAFMGVCLSGTSSGPGLLYDLCGIGFFAGLCLLVAIAGRE